MRRQINNKIRSKKSEGLEACDLCNCVVFRNEHFHGILRASAVVRRKHAASVRQCSNPGY